MRQWRNDGCRESNLILCLLQIPLGFNQSPLRKCPMNYSSHLYCNLWWDNGSVFVGLQLHPFCLCSHSHVLHVMHPTALCLLSMVDSARTHCAWCSLYIHNRQNLLWQPAMTIQSRSQIFQWSFLFLSSGNDITLFLDDRDSHQNTGLLLWVGIAGHPRKCNHFWSPQKFQDILHTHTMLHGKLQWFFKCIYGSSPKAVHAVDELALKHISVQAFQFSPGNYHPTNAPHSSVING
jgi:hypothetical protein